MHFRSSMAKLLELEKRPPGEKTTGCMDVGGYRPRNNSGH